MLDPRVEEDSACRRARPDPRRPAYAVLLRPPTSPAAADERAPTHAEPYTHPPRQTSPRAHTPPQAPHEVVDSRLDSQPLAGSPSQSAEPAGHPPHEPLMHGAPS